MEWDLYHEHLSRTVCEDTVKVKRSCRTRGSTNWFLISCQSHWFLEEESAIATPDCNEWTLVLAGKCAWQ